MVEFQENNTEVRKNLTKPNFFNNLIEFSKKSRATHQASAQHKSPSDIIAGRDVLFRVIKNLKKFSSENTPYQPLLCLRRL